MKIKEKIFYLKTFNYLLWIIKTYKKILFPSYILLKKSQNEICLEEKS